MGMRQQGKRRDWRIPSLIVLVLGILLISGNLHRQAQNRIYELEDQLAQLKQQETERIAANKRLMDQLARVGTDQHIEETVRLLYGYLRPGEIRFVPINPDSLYQPTYADAQPTPTPTVWTWIDEEEEAQKTGAP